MAYTSGTASNYKDLLAAMATFAAANGWTVLEQSETLLYMKGSGLAGLDEIYCGVETYEVPTSGLYNWHLYGSVGYRSGRAIGKHPRSSFGYSGATAVACFWNTSIPYWMFANGRRIIVVAKVGTTYQTVYLGLLTPPGTDAQYPYPLFIGGCTREITYKYSTTAIAAFWHNDGDYQKAGRLLTPSGAWGDLDSSVTSDYNPGVIVDHLLFEQETDILTGLDGSYFLTPVYLRGSNASRTIFGHLEGIFRVTGYNNTSENIITVDGVNYLSVQNIANSDYDDFCCIRMN